MSENKSSKVLILGISYKENCSDIRNSQILLLAEKMIENNMEVTIVEKKNQNAKT